MGENHPNPGHVTDRTWAKHLREARTYAASLNPGQAGFMLTLAERAVASPSLPNQYGGCNGDKQLSVHKANAIALAERAAQ